MVLLGTGTDSPVIQISRKYNLPLQPVSRRNHPLGTIQSFCRIMSTISWMPSSLKCLYFIHAFSFFRLKAGLFDPSLIGCQKQMAYKLEVAGLLQFYCTLFQQLVYFLSYLLLLCEIKVWCVHAEGFVWFHFPIYPEPFHYIQKLYV